MSDACDGAGPAAALDAADGANSRVETGFCFFFLVAALSAFSDGACANDGVARTQDRCDGEQEASYPAAAAVGEPADEWMDDHLSLPLGEILKIYD